VGLVTLWNSVLNVYLFWRIHYFLAQIDSPHQAQQSIQPIACCADCEGITIIQVSTTTLLTFFALTDSAPGEISSVPAADWQGKSY
jgi:hypothetical protein